MNIKSVIKLAISIGMLVIVMRMSRLDHLLSILGAIHPGYLVVIVLGYTAGQVINSFKWWLIARAGGIEAPYLTAVRVSFIGMYLNCFGLGTLGGDVARGLLLAQGEPHKAESLASVIADRLLGLAVLAAIGSLAALLFGRHNLDPILMSFLSLLGLGIIVGWFLGPWLVLKIFPATNRFRIKVEGVMHVFPKDFQTLWKIILVSVILHLLQISLHKVMGLALGISISWSLLFVTIPFVNLVSSLPISWNGLGVRENAYVFFLVPSILNPEQALAFGAMWLLAVTVSSAIGGIVAVLTNDLKLLNLKEGGDHRISAAS